MPLPLDLRRAAAKQRAEQDKINAAAEAELERQRTEAEEAARALDEALAAETDSEGGTARKSAKNAGGPPENKSAKK